MRELKVYKMVGEDYCDDSFCVVPSDVYLKSEADELIAELEEKHKKEVLQIRSAFNSLFRQTRTKRARLRKEIYHLITQPPSRAKENQNG